MGIKKVMAAALSAGMVMTVIPMVSMADTNGWVKDSTGWRYYTPSTGFVRNDWLNYGGKWYFFNSSGYMISGVENFYIKGIEYNFDDSGVCTNPKATAKTYTGWHRISYCYTDWDNDELKYDSIWFYYDSDGEAYKGWHKINGSWYYFGADTGVMYSGDPDSHYPLHVPEDEDYYWFKPSGELVTGWYYDGEYWYYARSNGKLYDCEWLYSGGAWYYFNDYRMLAGVDNVPINGLEYNFDSSGKCTNPSGNKPGSGYKGWRKVYNVYHDNFDWYYYEADGALCKGWKYLSGHWYYFDKSNGKMLSGRSFNEGDKKYYFKHSGEMATGWFKVEVTGISNQPFELWCYADSDGELYCDEWLNDGGDWYFFNDKGFMIADEYNFEIDGVLYSFDETGACLNPDGKSKVTGWIKRGKNSAYWNYFSSDGEMYIEKWLNENGNWYYFDAYGYMANDGTWLVGNLEYDFDSDGVCMNPYNGRVYG